MLRATLQDSCLNASALSNFPVENFLNRTHLPCLASTLSSRHYRTLRPPNKSCNMVCRCILRPGAALVGCGLISSSYASSGSCLDGGGGGGSGRSCRFGNGVAVEVGPETGGRTVTCYATMTLAEAASVAVDRASPEAVMEHQAAVEKFAEMARLS